MKLAFGLYKYFPYGGLQRDMLRIARACGERGHQIVILCAEWQGELPSEPALSVKILPVSGHSNHRKNRHFAQQWCDELAAGGYDRAVGFNKLPALDYYYAADTCFKAKLMEERSPLLRWLPRYRQFLRDEANVFSDGSLTRILAIAERSADEYERYYPGARARIQVLPPGINRDRQRPPEYAAMRADWRRQWQIADDQFALLAIGSGFRTKGVDRSLRALASLPPHLLARAHLLVIGQDKPNAFVRQANKLGVAERVRFLSGRDDIPAFLQGADLLLHPAYRENTGTVLLEAAIAGLPVIASGMCGYAHYLDEYNAGLVLEEPFEQRLYNQALEMLLSSGELRSAYSTGGLALAAQGDIYTLFERAADAICEPAP